MPLLMLSALLSSAGQKLLPGGWTGARELLIHLGAYLASPGLETGEGTGNENDNKGHFKEERHWGMRTSGKLFPLAWDSCFLQSPDLSRRVFNSQGWRNRDSTRGPKSCSSQAHDQKLSFGFQTTCGVKQYVDAFKVELVLVSGVQWATEWPACLQWILRRVTIVLSCTCISPFSL